MVKKVGNLNSKHLFYYKRRSGESDLEKHAGSYHYGAL